MTDIRSAVSEDLDGLTDLVRRFYEVDRHPFDAARVRRALEQLMSLPERGFILVVGEVGEPVAYIIVTFGFAIETGGVDALLDELFVAKPGEGVGSALMEGAMQLARQAGASRILLETQAHNRRARMFYTQHGFEIEDSIWMSRDL